MATKYFLIAALFSLACILQHSGAAITPVDKTYTAKAKKDFNIPWIFDDEADLDQVLWTYKSSASATTTTIMSKAGTDSAQIFNNFNVEHVSNGEIKLKSVKMDNKGIYFCQVLYTLSSGLPTVTGTATLSVTSAPTNTSTEPTTTSNPPTTKSTLPTTTTSTLPTTTSNPPTTTSTTPAITSTLASSTTDDKETVIIVSSVVGGLFIVGIAIFALIFFHRKRNRKHTSRKQSPKGNNHEHCKTPKPLYHQKNDYYLYNDKSPRRHVMENPSNSRVSKERNLGRSNRYFDEPSSRHFNYRPQYTMGHVHPSSTSGHQYMSEPTVDYSNPRNPGHTSYPGYSLGNIRYTNNQIFYY